jgi:alpha/beta superfamily hydrolase
VNPHTQIQFIEGPAGLIELAVDLPTGAGMDVGLGLIAHPHPLHGGNNNNKVVQTIARALRDLGLQTWRPNFRGVGQSQGAYDAGNGETNDLLALLSMAAKLLPGLGTPQRPLVLAGFSFGSFVAARVAHSLREQGQPPARLILVGPAALRFPMPEVASDTLVIHGEADEVVPLADVMDWARPLGLPVLVFPNTSHFFHGRLGLLKQHVQHGLGRLALHAAMGA